MKCANCGSESGLFRLCYSCDLKENKNSACREVKNIEAAGYVPFYAISDADKIFPYPLMTKEDVDRGFNALFG